MAETAGLAAEHDGRREQPAPDDVAEPLKGYRLLVVDNHGDTRDMMATLLSSLGADIEAVSSVPEALQRLDAARPDAVLADIGMPGSDGFDLIRELRTRDTLIGYPAPCGGDYRVCQRGQSGPGAGRGLRLLRSEAVYAVRHRGRRAVAVPAGESHTMTACSGRANTSTT